MKEKHVFIGVTIVPTLTLYLVFFLFPNVWSLYISLFQWRGTSMEKTFVAFRNYGRMLADEIIPQAIYNNFYLMMFLVVIGTSMGLLFAALVTQEKRKKFVERELYKTVFFFPNVLSIVVTSILWILIYSPVFGLINPALEALGLSDWTRVWLGNRNTVKPAIAVFFLWGNIGFNFVVFTSAIQGIPLHYYDAADIEGANKVYQFFRITVPLIGTIIRTCIVFAISAIFIGGFAVIKIMTEGGPNYASEILTTYMYRTTFSQFRFGYGATIGVLTAAITLVLVFITNRIGGRETHEY